MQIFMSKSRIYFTFFSQKSQKAHLSADFLMILEEKNKQNPFE